MDRLERDFYAIEEDERYGKRIHIFGYAYHCDDETDDKQYRFVEFTFNYIPVGLDACDFYAMYDLHLSECKQYIGDYDEDEIVKAMDNYFGEEPTVLDYGDITMDTPCGYYIQP